MAASRNTPIQDAADELDLSIETVRRDIKDRHCPCSMRAGRYYVNVPEYKAWRDEQGLTGERGRPPKESGDAQNEKDKWLARKYRVQALREEGAVVPFDDVEAWTNDHFGTMRDRLMILGDELAPQLEGRDAKERADIINGRVREILNELAEAISGRSGERAEAAEAVQSD
jgi:hypothetical protein